MAWLIADPVAAARKILTPDFVAPDFVAPDFVAPDSVAVDATCPDFPTWRGAYAVLIRLDEPLGTGFGRAKDRLAAGWYAYAGSARGPGGVGARIARHLRRDKKLHWHVDRLTIRAGRMVALALIDGNECAIAARLCQSGGFAHVLPGFGSSDCRVCVSHLLGWQANPFASQ